MPGERVIRHRSGAYVSSTGGIAALIRPPASSVAGDEVGDTIHKRPEGPGAEDELLILGLL